MNENKVGTMERPEIEQIVKEFYSGHYDEITVKQFRELMDKCPLTNRPSRRDESEAESKSCKQELSWSKYGGGWDSNPAV